MIIINTVPAPSPLLPQAATDAATYSFYLPWIDIYPIEIIVSGELKRGEDMIKYRCTVCGYIYDPEVGDTPRIKPGTAFEDLPDDWVCPQCGVGKDMFEKI